MKKFTMLFLLVSIIALSFCTTSKKAVANKKMKEATVFYDADVAPIMMNHCAPCHFPPQGQKLPLNSYTAVHDNIDYILYRVQLPHDDPKFMPFKMKKEPLSDSLIMVLKTWKEEGMMEMKAAK
jgi:hypothetical protein